MSATNPYKNELVNFKEETLDVLEVNGKSIMDIKWVGRLDYYNEETGEDEEVKYDLNYFLEKMDFEYDSGFGGVEIPLDLVIVGEDWWMERFEYDGQECWRFKCIPKEPEKIITVPGTIRDTWRI